MDDEQGRRYCKDIAQHFEQMKRWEMAEKFYIKAKCPQAAVDMYTRANKWDKAHKAALMYMSEGAVNTWFVNQAQRLEAEGKLKEAEKLYVMVNEKDGVDLAINMYKKNKHFEQMIRLVGKYKHAYLAETHIFCAQQLEQESRYKEAEKHYLAAKDWKSAVHMYRRDGVEMWDDALAVAQRHGGIAAWNQVAGFGCFGVWGLGSAVGRRASPLQSAQPWQTEP